MIESLLLALALPTLPQEAKAPPFPPIAQLLGPEPGVIPAPKMSFETALRRLGAGDAESRREALSALGQPGYVRAVPYLGGMLLRLDESTENRVAAAMALGRIRNWRTVAVLRQTLRDPARELRFASALALGKARTRESLRLLSGALNQDRDWWVRFAAAVALGESRDPEAVNALSGAARRDGEWQVRLQAVRSLGQSGSRQAVLALAGPLKDVDPSVRAASAMAIGQIGGLDAVRLLGDALRAETEEFPRRAIGDALKKLLER